jgi:uncharacterized protein
VTDGVIKIRGHHLLCILTYVGKGYSDSFVNNFNNISKRLNGGALIRVVNEPDDICKGWGLKGCPQPHNDRCHEGVVRLRDARAMEALNGVVFRKDPLSFGRRVSLTGGHAHLMRVNFTEGTIRGACGDCEWHRLCTEIAGKGYENVKLFPAAAPYGRSARAPSQRAGLLNEPPDQLAFPALIR